MALVDLLPECRRSVVVDRLWVDVSLASDHRSREVVDGQRFVGSGQAREDLSAAVVREQVRDDLVRDSVGRLVRRVFGPLHTATYDSTP